MIIKLNKTLTPEELEKQLRNRKPTNVIHAKKHLVKVKWKEDGLAYHLSFFRRGEHKFSNITTEDGLPAVRGEAPLLT